MEKKLGNSEPWKKIQAQLGHELLETTTKVYILFVEIFDGAEGTVNVRQLLGV